jgi:transcriptional regulator GlxA family with amidase domain
MALIGLCTEDFPRPGAATPADPASGDALVDAAVHHIWNHGHRVLDVPTLAATVGVCRRTLETRFLRARGCSILEEINRTRLERAEELLANTILPVADVAGLSGFGSTEAMRKTFLQHRGIRPSDIRRGR